MPDKRIALSNLGARKQSLDWFEMLVFDARKGRDEGIIRAHDAGATFEEIGRVLKTSKQNAHEIYHRALDSQVNGNPRDPDEEAA